MSSETMEEVRARGKREHEAKYAALCKTLGSDSLAGLVEHLIPSVKRALAAGDEHLNTISLATWDRLAGITGALGPSCCGKLRQSPFCPDCGKQLRQRPGPGRDDWPYSELRETARDKSLPWHRAPGLSLSERVCALKYTAGKLATAQEDSPR